jgi:hypothetical protein
VNTDLFQSLTVALLGAITILLIVAIATLGRLRRSVETSSSSLRDELTRLSSTAQSTAQTQPEPAGAEAGGAEDQHADDAVETEAPTPVEGQERADEPVAGAVAASADGTAAESREHQEADRSDAAPGGEEEPQEQPYERDGRWWFRRGEELLVYDEPTGQWLQVEGPATATYTGYTGQAAEASAATVATESRTSTLAAESAVEQQEGSAEASRSFWKCPSCGAINGATASSCRMCFSARP